MTATRTCTPAPTSWRDRARTSADHIPAARPASARRASPVIAVITARVRSGHRRQPWHRRRHRARHLHRADWDICLAYRVESAAAQLPSSTNVPLSVPGRVAVAVNVCRMTQFSWSDSSANSTPTGRGADASGRAGQLRRHRRPAVEGRGHGRRPRGTDVAVNVTGTLLCRRGGRTPMSSRQGGGGGVIVNVSSARVTPWESRAEYVDYAALQRDDRHDDRRVGQRVAGEGIRRGGACDRASIETDITSSGGQPDRLESPALTQIPDAAGRARPDEVAATIEWLCSDAAST